MYALRLLILPCLYLLFSFKFSSENIICIYCESSA